MKLTIVTGDKKIIDIIQNFSSSKNLSINMITTADDPLDLVLKIIVSKPKWLIFDDDLAAPHSNRVLKAVSSMMQNVSLIFLTSTASVELGREISQLGVDFYGIKPMSGIELTQSINSILKQKSAIS